MCNVYTSSETHTTGVLTRRSTYNRCTGEAWCNRCKRETCTTGVVTDRIHTTGILEKFDTTGGGDSSTNQKL